MEGDLERYLRDIRRVGEDLEKAVRAAAKDLDRLGREVLEDTAANAKLGGKEAEEALLRLEKDQEGGPTSAGVYLHRTPERGGGQGGAGVEAAR